MGKRIRRRQRDAIVRKLPQESRASFEARLVKSLEAKHERVQ